MSNPLNIILDLSQRLALKAAARIEIMAAVIVVAVVFMLILPLPTALLDGLIAFNISVSALLVALAIYLPGPLAFSSFPSVLLLTTLFRLSISVATTRLILLDGDAGHIVETFGAFVVGGNLVVGLVVFLILTIVQFIVITKGSERVAEVAARFTLDGMPGKQMSIDSDLRANLIDSDEARRRRRNLERESQLFGAMDGSMKFVKGDAIAGLIIVFVNLLGGLAIGVFQRDMSAADAIRTYSVLTIGDGLIAQIPALFISITAGMIITRVAGNDPSIDSNIGQEITQQMLAQPRALAIAGLVLCGFALIPGMPTGIFLVLAAIFLGAAWLHKRMALRKNNEAGFQNNQDPASIGSPSDSDLSIESLPEVNQFVPYSPLVFEYSTELRNAGIHLKLISFAKAARNEIVLSLGVPLPALNARASSLLSGNTFRLLVDEVPVRTAEIRHGWLCAIETAEALRAIGLDPQIETDSIDGLRRMWIEETKQSILEECGIPYQTAFKVTASLLGAAIRRHVHSFLGIQEVSAILSSVEEDMPELVKEAQRVIPVAKLAEVLQRLVSEDVSIRNLRLILQTLIDWAQKERDTVVLTEQVRIALRQQICHHFSDRGVLAAYVFSPEIEDLIRNAIRQTSMGSFLALDPQTSRRLLDKIRSALGDLSELARVPVLLVPMDLRRYLRKLIEGDLFRVPVLSYTEIVPELSVQPLARIEL